MALKVGDRVRADVEGVVIEIRPPESDAPWVHQDNGILIRLDNGFEALRWEAECEKID